MVKNIATGWPTPLLSSTKRWKRENPAFVVLYVASSSTTFPYLLLSFRCHSSWMNMATTSFFPLSMTCTTYCDELYNIVKRNRLRFLTSENFLCVVWLLASYSACYLSQSFLCERLSALVCAKTLCLVCFVYLTLYLLRMEQVVTSRTDSSRSLKSIRKVPNNERVSRQSRTFLVEFVRLLELLDYLIFKLLKLTDRAPIRMRLYMQMGGIQTKWILPFFMLCFIQIRALLTEVFVRWLRNLKNLFYLETQAIQVTTVLLAGTLHSRTQVLNSAVCRAKAIFNG